MKFDKNCWREYRFLLLVVLVLAGFWLFGSNILDLTETRLSYTTNVFTESLSIAVTVLIVDFLNRAREKRDQADLQKRLDKQELNRLKALLGSNENVVTKIAVAELRAKGWLSDGSLNDTNLVRANLEGADLSGAHLEGANLVRAHLEETNLDGAHLEKANLQSTYLQGASLVDAHLENTNLEGAYLARVRLLRAHLEGANLVRIHLGDANLTGAHLEGANLTGAYLEVAMLYGAHLEGAYLKGAHLEGTYFQFTYAEEAHKHSATLPDGTIWSENVDMERFTNPNHTEFDSTLAKINKIRKELGF